MILQILIFAVSIFLIIRGATLSTRFSGRIAKSFNLSNYVVGFLIVAVISIIPEAFVAINSVISGVPSMGLGTIFGSNGEGYIRFALCVQEAKVQEAIDRFRN